MCYVPGFLGEAEADALLDALEREVSWQREFLSIFGREVAVPRLIAWCGEPGSTYRYSAREHRARGWLEPLVGMRKRLERTLGVRFDFALLNRYAGGDDYMGWHTDDEPEIRGPVASVSLGAPRRFLFRPSGVDGPSERLVLEHGSLLVFDPSLRHTLPRCARAGLRINVTFRGLRSGEPPR